jgi:hypothetical protein
MASRADRKTRASLGGVLDRSFQSALLVRVDESVPGGLAMYKIYANGFIHRTPPRFARLMPANVLYTRIAPGSYRVVAREKDPHKPGRMESNTVRFDLGDDETVYLRLPFLDGSLSRLSLLRKPTLRSNLGTKFA